MQIRRVLFLAACAAALSATADRPRAATGEKHLLYAAVPGIRNYLEYGGIGRARLRHGRRAPAGAADSRRSRSRTGVAPENVKGIAASAATGRLYVSTIRRVAAIDLAHRQDGLEQDLRRGRRPHRAVAGRQDSLRSLARRAALARRRRGDRRRHREDRHRLGRAQHDLRSRRHACLSRRTEAPQSWPLPIPKTHKVVGGVGPFSSAIRPFTINNAQTLCFVNVNGLLGFEVGDIQHRQDAAPRARCPATTRARSSGTAAPATGSALTPDEKELWLADGANSRLHIFDATVMPPTQGRQPRASATSPAGSRSASTAATPIRRPAK